MSKNYFTEEEYTRSDTAKRLGIDNRMNELQRRHFEAMREDILNPFRKEWGEPIIVTSGFRCPALNQAVGGVSTSAHIYGFGIDLVPTKRSVEELFDALKWWLLRKEKRFDQLILETDGKTQWVHFGYKNKEGFARGQIKNISK